MMEKILWDDEQHSVGHPLIDTQNKKITRLINELIDLYHTGYTEEDLRRSCDKMLTIAYVHFGSEEAILRSFDAPNLDAHIDAHNQYTSRLLHMLEKHLSCDIDAMLLFLDDWFTAHILVEDMKYKTLFSGSNNGSTPAHIQSDVPGKTMMEKIV